MEKLLRVSDVADLLNVKPQTVYMYARQDYLAHVKLGGRLRFRPEDVQKFVTDHVMSAEPVPAPVQS